MVKLPLTSFSIEIKEWSDKSSSPYAFVARIFTSNVLRRVRISEGKRLLASLCPSVSLYKRIRQNDSRWTDLLEI